MSLSLIEVRRLAVNVAEEEDTGYEVLGTARGGTGYAEVVVAEPGKGDRGRFVIGLNREADERTARDVVRTGLREHAEDRG